MSYVVLARKYRPRRFDEVIGQDVVTRVLTGALDEGRLGHAYLFAGPRGTGKTTTARIFAKCLNCENGPTSNPCGECEGCKGADEGTAVDIKEIDAASHTGVDDIRELRDEVGYAPMRARYKVYIIDEVHMLSKAAFNALLKTLEEPPPHVVFLFATTEPHKVLDTVLSRCQVMRLSALSEEAITARLEQVFEWEHVEAEDGVTRELARGARGGMRDALSLADKLLALSGDAPTLEDLERLGGDGGTREVRALLGVLESREKAQLLEHLGAFQGSETELLAGLLGYLRHALVVAYCGEETPLVPGTNEERAEAGAFAVRIGSERIELWMQELLRARERMRLLAGQERLVLEITLLDLCRPETSIPLTELVSRLEGLEAGLPAPPPAPRRAAAPPRAAAPDPPEREIRPVPAPAPDPAPAPAAARPDRGGLWKGFLAELKGTRASLAELLQAHGRLEELGSSSYRVALDRVDPDSARLLGDGRNRRAMERAFLGVAGTGASVRFDDPTGGVDSPEKATEKAPVAREAEPDQQAEPDQKTERPARAPGGDELTQEVADLFGGVIEDLG